MEIVGGNWRETGGGLTYIEVSFVIGLDSIFDLRLALSWKVAVIDQVLPGLRLCGWTFQTGYE